MSADRTGPLPTPPQRVSAIPLPERYALPPRPAEESPQVQDAYRQTLFSLGADLRLFEEGMNLQLAILAASSGSHFRTHAYAALVSLWSRTFSALADALLLTTRGSYGSALPLVRTACECVAAQRQLYAQEMDLYREWLLTTLRPHEEFRAFEFGLGHYFAGETLAADERLRSVYRPAADLARPNFGATTLITGPESNNLRLAYAFDDHAFHLGWAEIIMGWLLALCERQLHTAVHATDLFHVPAETHEAYRGFARWIDARLGDSARARIEEVTEDNFKRYLVHNFRRSAGAAPRRVLL
jgi:hypothetical protein